MSDKASVWMPFYVGDYLGDTQRLTTEQHGAYLLLILDYWRNGPAPDEDAVLQQITKLDKAGWKRNRAALARLFQVGDGVWRHKRIDRELVDAQSNSERRSSKAKAAAQARWANAASNAPSIPQALPEECPSPSPSPKEEGSDTDVSGSVAADDEPALPEQSPTPDPLKVMFDSGIRLFALEGKSDRVARPLLGKWRSEYGPEAVIVALGMAQREGAVDLTSFMERCLKNGRLGRNSGNGQQEGSSGSRTIDAARSVASKLGITGAGLSESPRPSGASDSIGRTDCLPNLGGSDWHDEGGARKLAAGGNG